MWGPKAATGVAIGPAQGVQRCAGVCQNGFMGSAGQRDLVWPRLGSALRHKPYHPLRKAGTCPERPCCATRHAPVSPQGRPGDGGGSEPTVDESSRPFSSVPHPLPPTDGSL